MPPAINRASAQPRCSQLQLENCFFKVVFVYPFLTHRAQASLFIHSFRYKEQKDYLFFGSGVLFQFISAWNTTWSKAITKCFSHASAIALEITIHQSRLNKLNNCLDWHEILCRNSWPPEDESYRLWFWHLFDRFPWNVSFQFSFNLAPSSLIHPFIFLNCLSSLIPAHLEVGHRGI